MYNFDDKGQVLKVTITEEPLGIFAKVKFDYGTDVEGFWNETEFRKAIMNKCDESTLWEDDRCKFVSFTGEELNILADALEVYGAPDLLKKINKEMRERDNGI